MSKKGFIVIFIIYLIMLGLNCMTPLSGDDYVYAFIWPNQFMNIPLPENAVRVKSVHDVILSQWRHYLTGNGRTVAHLFVQFFIWKGKWLFNIFNAFAFVILVLQIHWISDAGKISLKKLRVDSICWIFFILWTLNASFQEVYLWLDGACNYLWSLIILLFFLLPYIQYFFKSKCLYFSSSIAKCCFFFLGLCAGWGNENTICWIIVILGVWLSWLYKLKQLEKWMIWGYFGFFTGYVLLILAPGNAIKTNFFLKNFYLNNWWNVFSWEYVRQRLMTFVIIENYQLVLWYFILTSLKRMREESKSINKRVSKHICLAKVFCVLSILVNVIMIFTPYFPVRSGYASLLFITIAASLVIRTQAILKKDNMDIYLKKILTVFGTCIFVITLIFTYWGTYLVWQYDSELMKQVSIYQKSNRKDILEVPEFIKGSKYLDWASGQHLKRPMLKEDENSWINVAFARYYGITGIRTAKSD